MSETEPPKNKTQAITAYLDPDDIEYIKAEAYLHGFNTSEMFRHIVGVYKNFPQTPDHVEARENLMRARREAKESGYPAKG